MMLGYEKEMDIFGLEMALGEELCQQTPKLNVEIIRELSESFNIDKKIVQQVLNSFLEEERTMKWCEKSYHGDGKYLVSDDYGGPDSGYMGYHCRKCGFSDGSQLY